MGSRTSYQKMAESHDWQNKIDSRLMGFLEERDSFYLATANSNGQPYIQHRGGPKGFLKVLGEDKLGFADFGCNKQFITTGNLSENNKVHLFLMDYPNRARVKIWGTAEVIENDIELLEHLIEPHYQAKPERVIVVTISAWDINCPQHITPRYTVEENTPQIEELQSQIGELEKKPENHTFPKE